MHEKTEAGEIVRNYRLSKKLLMYSELNIQRFFCGLLHRHALQLETHACFMETWGVSSQAGYSWRDITAACLETGQVHV